MAITSRIVDAGLNVTTHLQRNAVYCGHWVSPDGFIGALHQHVGCEIIYCQSGKGVLTVGNQSVPYHADHILYFDCRTPHQARVQGRYERWGLCFWREGMLDRGWRSNTLQLEELVTSVGPGPGEIRLFAIPREMAPRFERYFLDIQEELNQRQRNFENVILLRLIELHLLLNRLEYLSLSDAAYRKEAALSGRIGEILNFIETNLHKDLSVETIAAHFHYSPSHLNRLIRRATGKPPSEYLRERRIARASRLLARTDLSITEIASTVGIANVAYFSRIFRSSTGTTPREFRRRHAEI